MYRGVIVILVRLEKSIPAAPPLRLAHNLVVYLNHHVATALFLSAFLDSLLTGIHRTFAFCLVGHLFSGFGIWSAQSAASGEDG
jgi:hypothetical protein